MKCPNCNHELSDTAKLCDQCGTRRPHIGPDPNINAVAESARNGHTRACLSGMGDGEAWYVAGMDALAMAKLLLGVDAKDAEIARLKAELEPLRVLRADCMHALQGEAGSDADDGSIVSAVLEWSNAIRALPQGVIDCEIETLEEGVDKLKEQARTAAANARREALEEVRKLVKVFLDRRPPEVGAFTAQLYSLRFVSQPAAETQTPRLASDIAELSKLVDGWDSYGGKKPTQAALDAAAKLQLCPVSDGGVQIECGGGSLEIGPDGKAVEEQPPTRDVEGLARVLERCWIEDDCKDYVDIAKAVFAYLDGGPSAQAVPQMCRACGSKDIVGETCPDCHHTRHVGRCLAYCSTCAKNGGPRT